jgi:hypothetical protein
VTGTPAERDACLRFSEALVDFSGDPGFPNLARYLAASRALEESRRLARMPSRDADRRKSPKPVRRTK